MKLAGKFLTAFALVAIVPVVLTAILLYLYVESSTSEAYARRSEGTVRLTDFLIGGELTKLDQAVTGAIAETDLVVAVIDWEKRAGDLEQLLRGRIARGDFDFAVISESSLNRSLTVVGETRQGAGAAIELKANFGGESLTGVIHLSADGKSSALVARTPIMFRGTVIGELAAGRLLADAIRPMREVGDLEALIGAQGEQLVFVEAADTALLNAAASIAQIETQQEIWQASLGKRQFIVREAPIYGVDGAPALSILYLFEAEEIAADRRHLMRTLTGIGTLAIVLALLAGYFVQRSLTRPLEHVAESARRIAAGSAPERVHYYAEDEVGEVVGAINRLAEDLRQTEVRLRQSEQVAAWQMFARQTAHELKNFLMPVATSLSQLQRRVDAGECDRAAVETTIRDVYAEISRMKNLLGSFSEFARMPAPERRAVNLRHVIERTLLGFGAEVAGGKLHFDTPPLIENIDCDAEQMQQVLHNLVKNSFEAHASMVLIKVEQDERKTSIDVIDDGEGIDTSRGIDPFTPLFTTKERGSGLGLAICRRIIVDHGGEIAWTPNAPRGTVFSITLPREKA